MRACNKVLLMVVWVWLMLPSTPFSGGMLPLQFLCQADPRGLLGRSHLVITVRYNECDGVSNHQPHDCLFNRLFRHRWKKTSKLRVTDLCADLQKNPCWFKTWMGFVGPTLTKLGTSFIWDFSLVACVMSPWELLMQTCWWPPSDHSCVQLTSPHLSGFMWYGGLKAWCRYLRSERQ